MQDILEHAIRTVPHGSGPFFLPWQKVKFSARKNASEGYAYDCGLFHIVAIMDTTLLKSGKEGYALGCHALYGTGFQEPISLHGLKQATVRADAPGRRDGDLGITAGGLAVRQEEGYLLPLFPDGKGPFFPKGQQIPVALWVTTRRATGGRRGSRSCG